MNKEIEDEGGATGSYVIKITDSKTGKLLRTIGPIKNKIVNNTGRGYDILSKQLGGDTTYQLEIDSGKIGTGTNPASSADTDLQTPVLSDIDVADVQFPTAGQVKIDFFITDGSLANATYNEFGIFANGQLFARSILSPALTKGSNQNITIEYTITFS